MKMNKLKDNQGFVTRLEQLKLKEGSNYMNPSSAADVYRSLYLHVQEGNAKNLDGAALRDEASFYLKKYTDVVDCMDDSGLNNYAEGALALCSHHKNESTKWQSALSVESILQLPLLQDCRDEPTEEKQEDDPVIPLRKETMKQIQGPSTSYDDNQGLIFKHSTNQRLSSKNLLPSSEHQKSKSVFTDKKSWDQGSNRAHYTAAVRRNNFHMSNVQGGESPHNSVRGTDTCKSSDSWHDESHRVSANHGNFSFKLQNHSMNHSAPNGHMTRDVPDEASFEVNPSKYGGPFANFGQKRKVQNTWNDYQRGGGSGSNLWKTQARDNDEDGVEEDTRATPFKTAKQQFIINQQKKFGNTADRSQVSSCSYGAIKKSLGTRRGPASKFVPPILNRDSDENEIPLKPRRQNAGGGGEEPNEPMDERLKGIDPKMIELINNEIMDHGADITWSDVAGLEFAKKTIKEIVVWPMLRPDIFTGLRGPPKGLLLFGPPGTGKTLIGKCIASQSKSTFFCISASSLTSKWVGEGEKMVRALFSVARCNQPAVVFIDEIDSLLSQRSDGEHESSRRIKTEFLVQLDGASTASEDRILVIGATNRPQEIDEAARRRFVKRLLIPLPESIARKQIVINLMSQQKSSLSEIDIDAICSKTDGYSGADMSNLCREAALGPIRSIPLEQMETITPEQVRPILYQDFQDAMLQVRASVSPKDLELYVEWNKTYGSFGCS